MQKRKDFLINCAYVSVLALIAFFLIKFTFAYLMPFVVGFIIAFLLKPIVRKLDKLFGENKAISLVVIVLFYTLVAALGLWLVFRVVATVEFYIPRLDNLYKGQIAPMINTFLTWLEELIGGLDPDLSQIVETGINNISVAISKFADSASSSILNWVTAFVASAPNILIATLISVISSFFFTMDYQRVVNTVLGFMPKRLRFILLDVKNNFGVLIGKYLKAYAFLMTLTFLELSLGFFLLKFKNPMGLAAIIAIIDILPVLGTGTVLIPWSIYLFATGEVGLAVGILIMYGIITVIRNVLEPKVIGQQIGLHPLITLMSIFAGAKLFGFFGLFATPIAVTILIRLHEDKKLNLLDFFNGVEDNKIE